MTPWMHWVERKTERWTSIRSWIDLPVIVAFIAVAGTGISLSMWKRTSIEAKYEQLIAKGLTQKDFETAEIASRRLLARTEGEKGRYLFYLSLAMEGAGKPQEAAMYLDRAAPLETPGFAPAHLAQARTLLDDKSPSPENIQKATAHLRNAIQADANNASAREILGRLYLIRSEWKDAIECLTPLALQKPETIFAIAQAARQSGDLKTFDRWMADAAQIYSNRVKTALREDPRDRVLWATALAARKIFPQAVEVIEEGIKKRKDNAYDKSLGEIYATWVTSESGNPKDRITRICRGLEHDPANAVLLEHIFRVTRQKGAEADAAREAVTALLAQGGNSAVLHFMAGNDAWAHGEADKARTHWDLANQIFPLAPAIANNLAMVLSQGNDADLNRALELIDGALKQAPNEPNFHETRGHLLLKLGRTQDAVVELERALPLVSRKRGTHLRLAEAYDKLGMQELSSRHKELARDIE